MGLCNRLAGTIPESLLPRVSDHFGVIGDIAIVEIPPDLQPFQQEIAQAIVSERGNIATVLKKSGKTSGDSRTASFEVILGQGTETVHREFGFSYRVDVGQSFFSPRMARERHRVTEQARQGESIYVPFAGVGPFAIPAAARGADVWAGERNPVAFRLLEQNVRLNRVGDRCHAVQGDALDPAVIPLDTFDRLIIPAPYGVNHALFSLLPHLAPGGTAHWYWFGPQERVPGQIALYKAGGLDVTFHAPCGNVAPGISRWVFDLVCSLR